MSRSARRREQRAALAARVAAGTWEPKPPVGRLRLVYRVREDLAPVMAEDIHRGQHRETNIPVAVSD